MANDYDLGAHTVDLQPLLRRLAASRGVLKLGHHTFFTNSFSIAKARFWLPRRCDSGIERYGQRPTLEGKLKQDRNKTTEMRKEFMLPKELMTSTTITIR